MKTIFVTGVSSGLGRAFAESAITAGHHVVGSVRTPEAAAAFDRLHTDRATAVVLDVTDDEALLGTVERIESGVAPIDVVVANAGYGQEGTFEESSMADLRKQFDTNVFGAVATIKAALPYMRERRAGHIIGVTSMAGLMTVPGLSFYHGSKWALEGILESLGQEIHAFGIHVTAVAPGSFRTNWAGSAMARAPRTIPDYDAMFEPIRAARLAADGRQLGDPQRAAEVLVALLESPEPPRHLLLGSDALRLVRRGRAAVDEEIERWLDVTRSTDFEDGHQIS